MMLPTDDKERAKYRLCDYYMGYFLKAQLAKTKHSYESNIKHCGEEGMTWASEKSIGDGNQIMRHLVDGMHAVANDDIREAEYHLTCLAWRADELLERLLNKMPPFEHLKSVGLQAIDVDDLPTFNLDEVLVQDDLDKINAVTENIRETFGTRDEEESLPKPMSFKGWIESKSPYDEDMCELYKKYESYIKTQHIEQSGDAV